MVDTRIVWGTDPYITLLSATDTTGDSKHWPGGSATWQVWGTWDGATAQLQISPDEGTTWLDVTGASVTENGGWLSIPVPQGLVRVSIADAGTTSLSSNIRPA